MLDAVFNRLDVAKHHRGAGIQSEPVRHVHDFQPVAAHRLERRNVLAHAVHENFPAAAGNRTEAGRFEIGNDFFQRLVEHLAEMDELAGAETVDVDLRKFGFDVRQQIQIPLLRQLGMMAALHENLRAAERERLLDLLVHLVERNDVGVSSFSTR